MCFFISAVSIVTRLQAGQQGFDSRQEQRRDLLFTTAAALSPGDWPGRDADHSHHSRAEVNSWSHTSTPSTSSWPGA
jgi:hypothetical protein